ncbi:uncharacterized protein LOC128614059 isoform X1 [Ictalurus furcatus]|uniref:uncharacterized protein LOC128614059 isoform X1 n=1 Tax=Ictalurus furcatus TaxID=66913 RepID=UPI00234FED01|nr:uncharacterized protein LOC128614059 isoform X1 [Ictalurus furcatus]XP_053491311.1 uncharacterized protein LOC128614059 isoform X1 [Ictalurus furcatus]XP_053491312.1 uncharacterized protein LOC128614059 isoform X1 [Ictalurus furcatus]XP_053491313.1 uncharacterized protein LOC128614059 isoform X1 [Ictalurus furcatus]XP_053491314.1 uncharacterized protein LOC128614059 isoform X1 [Ictalurus furcatus]XP_053491315.1 uncharacterized protein LOC128614059 isoform X1 [Ictalurus furcatus]XP_05349131
MIAAVRLTALEMLTCFVHKAHLRTCLVLRQHLKFQHGLYLSKKLHLKCGEPGRPLSFCTCSGFRKHLSKVHSHTMDQEIDTNQDLSTQGEYEAECSNDRPNSVATLHTSQSSVVTSQLSSMCGSIVAHLQASGLSESAVQTIVYSVEEVVNDVKIQARDAVLKTDTPESTSSDTCRRTEHCFDHLGNPFSALNTESRRHKYYDEKWEIVEPKECVLGVRMDLRRDRTTGIYSQVPVTDKCMYVPILGTLKSIFKNGQVRESFLQDKQSGIGVNKDINDGSYFQNHALFSQQKHALQILLYYNDFETANPLGSKRGIHKLGCIYFTL